jgi:Rad3-related DNA helicase
VLDIEDLFEKGKNSQICPFYLGRDLLKPAHVVFLPYNYLLNDGFLDTVRDFIGESIMIFDEAHNVPNSAQENQSFEFDTRTMSNSMIEMKEMLKWVNKNSEASQMDKYRKI